eukprot:10543157-Lingulodinium_polyedra.AAC.1
MTTAAVGALSLCRAQWPDVAGARAPERGARPHGESNGPAPLRAVTPVCPPAWWHTRAAEPR